MSLESFVICVVLCVLCLFCGFKMGLNAAETTEDKLKAIAEHEAEIERLRKEVGK